MCDICGQECKELMHLPLYVFGSEGIMVCLNCRIAITEYVRRMRSVASVARKQGFLAGKIIRSATSDNKALQQIGKMVAHQEKMPPEFNQAVDKMLDDKIANG